MGLSKEDMAGIVRDWRKANPHIVKAWSILETAAQRCVTTGHDQKALGLRFSRTEDGTMTVTLPSGRLLCYRNMMLGKNRFGGTSLKYRGVNSETKQWGWIETYGGKLTENIVQAIARDCLAHTLLTLDDFGRRSVFHVHDEVICEVRKDTATSELKTIQEIFAAVPAWADGLPLKGAGYTTDYYLKD